MEHNLSAPIFLPPYDNIALRGLIPNSDSSMSEKCPLCLIVDSSVDSPDVATCVLSEGPPKIVCCRNCFGNEKEVEWYKAQNLSTRMHEDIIEPSHKESELLRTLMSKIRSHAFMRRILETPKDRLRSCQEIAKGDESRATYPDTSGSVCTYINIRCEHPSQNVDLKITVTLSPCCL